MSKKRRDRNAAKLRRRLKAIEGRLLNLGLELSCLRQKPVDINETMQIHRFRKWTT